MLKSEKEQMKKEREILCLFEHDTHEHFLVDQLFEKYYKVYFLLNDEKIELVGYRKKVKKKYDNVYEGIKLTLYFNSVGFETDNLTHYKVKDFVKKMQGIKNHDSKSFQKVFTRWSLQKEWLFMKIQKENEIAIKKF
jgi:hypothetical protein